MAAFARTRFLRNVMSSEGSVTRWVTALKSGDAAAAQPLWERYHRQLVSLARNKLRNFLTRRRAHERGAGGTDAHRLLEAQPDRHDGEAEVWDEEYRRRLFAWAAERVRAECHEATWSAFWRTAVEGWPAEEVAGELGMTAAAVYVAKSRVMARLRECIREIEGEP